MIRGLRQSIEDTRLKGWEMPVDQMNGIHLALASLPSAMPFTTVKDYENYIARLHAIPRALEQTTEVMKLGLRDRLMPPKYLLEKVGEQAQGIADDKPESSPYAQPAEKFRRGGSGGGTGAAAQADSGHHREGSESGLRRLRALRETGLHAAWAHRIRHLGAAQWRRALRGGGEGTDHDEPESSRNSRDGFAPGGGNRSGDAEAGQLAWASKI